MPDFMIAKTYQVNRDFRFNGKAFGSGDVFDWRRRSCDVRQLRRLFDAKLIKHHDDVSKVKLDNIKPGDEVPMRARPEIVEPKEEVVEPVEDEPPLALEVEEEAVEEKPQED